MLFGGLSLRNLYENLISICVINESKGENKMRHFVVSFILILPLLISCSMFSKTSVVDRNLAGKKSLQGHPMVGKFVILNDEGMPETLEIRENGRATHEVHYAGLSCTGNATADSNLELNLDYTCTGRGMSASIKFEYNLEGITDFQKFSPKGRMTVEGESEVIESGDFNFTNCNSEDRSTKVITHCN